MADEYWIGPRIEPLPPAFGSLYPDFPPLGSFDLGIPPVPLLLLPPPPLNILAGFDFGAAPDAIPADPAPSADDDLYQQLADLFEGLKNWRQEVIVSIDGLELGRAVVTFFDEDPGDLETWLSRCGFARPGEAQGSELAASAGSAEKTAPAATDMPPVALSDGITYLWSEEQATLARPSNPYRRGIGESKEDWLNRLRVDDQAWDRLPGGDTAAVTDLRAQMNDAIAAEPGFLEAYPAYQQHIDPDFYADPEGYVRALLQVHPELGADALKPVPKAQADIVHWGDLPPIDAYIRSSAGQRTMLPIASNGTVYDIEAIAQYVRKTPPIPAKLYADNDLRINQDIVRAAIASDDWNRVQQAVDPSAFMPDGASLSHAARSFAASLHQPIARPGPPGSDDIATSTRPGDIPQRGLPDHDEAKGPGEGNAANTAGEARNPDIEEAKGPSEGKAANTVGEARNPALTTLGHMRDGAGNAIPVEEANSSFAFKRMPDIGGTGANLEAASAELVRPEPGFIATFDAKAANGNGFDVPYAKLVDGKPRLVVVEDKSGAKPGKLTAFGQGKRGWAQLRKNSERLADAIEASDIPREYKGALVEQAKKRTFSVELHVSDASNVPQSQLNFLDRNGLTLDRIVVIPDR